MNTTITQNDSVSDEYVQCANRLIDLMERHQLRQIDISEIIGASRGTVSKWISADAVPSGKYLDRLGRVFNVKNIWILKGGEANSCYEHQPTIEEVSLERHRSLFIEELSLDHLMNYDIYYLYGMYVDKIKLLMGNDKAEIRRLIATLNINTSKVPAKMFVGNSSANDTSDYPVFAQESVNGSTHIIKAGQTPLFDPQAASDAGADTSHCFCYHNTDKGMAPTISHNAACWIDSSKKEIRDGNLYLISYGEILLMRYAFKKHDGSILLRAANDSHDDILIERLDTVILEVLGWVYSYTHTSKW